MRRVAVAMSTTGPEPRQGHRITELAAVEMNGGAAGKTLHLRIAQDVASGPSETGVPFSEAIARWTQFIAGRPMVVHDYYEFKRFLRAESKRASAGFDIARDYPVVDTWLLVRERFPRQRHSLKAVAQKLGIEANAVALDALETAMVVVRVANKLSAIDDADLSLCTTEAKRTQVTPDALAAALDKSKIEAYVSPISKEWQELIAQIGRFWRKLTGGT